MTKNNVVPASVFLKKREIHEKETIIRNLKLNSNDFAGNMEVEVEFDRYIVRVICNFNEHVIVVKEEFSIIEGIDLEVLTAKIAEELAIHVLVDTLKDALRNNEVLKYYMKKEPM